ncbi:hypothetical protein P2G88_06375 [Aliiglaciecola sp. CAU 1673]|uniref:hypothetical protein n=1 Tax=Aliiglaciecola sp. CAU 1673 TaxID=3032595 RepID=UPI0023DACC9F|nr:hypothetical protein [Aliiglaciecola sp. CAU 1673]MDF2177872.1 hypothetical protein [Aliiglaciecola sp. CAU 1673]
MRNLALSRLAAAIICTSLLSSCGGSNGTITPTPTPPEILTLRIEGQVIDDEVANAIVSLSLGEQNFSTAADAQGVYGLEISFEKGSLPQDTVLQLTASGQGGQEHIELSFGVGSFDKLVQLAGEDRVLQNSEAATNITHVTTAMDLLAKEKNGDAYPSSDDQLESAKIQVQPDSLLNLASAIKVLADNSAFTPPEGVTTLSLFEQAAKPEQALDNYLISQGIKDAQGNLSAQYLKALEDAQTETLSQEAVIQDFTESQLSGNSNVFMIAHHPDFLPWYSNTLLLNEDKTGTYGDERSDDQVNNESPVTWRIEGKKLHVDYEVVVPLDTSTSLTEEWFDWATGIFDQALVSKLREWQQQGKIPDWLFISIARLSSDFTLLTETSSGGVVAAEHTYSYQIKLDQWLVDELPAGTSLLAEYRVFHSATTWSKQFESEMDNGDASGKWVLPIPMEFPLLGGKVAQDYMPDMLNLKEDGTVEFTLATNLNGVTWSANDGAITLSNVQENGISYRYTPYKKRGNQYLTLIERYQGNQLLSSFSRLVTKVDSAVHDAFVQDMITELPEFYLAHSGSVVPSRWNGELLTTPNVFGYQFNTDGSAKNVAAGYTDPFNETGIELRSLQWNWQLTGNLLTLSRYEPNWMLHIDRHWYVLDREEKGRYVLLEWATWNSTDEMGLRVAPRLNIIEKTSLALWPDLWNGTDEGNYIPAETASPEDIKALMVEIGQPLAIFNKFIH